VREIDGSHATTAELALERVAVGQGGLEAFQGLGQRDVPEWGTSRLNLRARTDQSQPQLLPFLLQFVRARPGIAGQGSGLGPVVERRCDRKLVVADGDEPAVVRRAQHDPLLLLLTMPAAAEHLLPGENELDRPGDVAGRE
jgi:hypothetical protein